MALVKCEECGKQVSDRAESCPSCGAKPKNMEIEKKSDASLKRNIFIGFFVLVMVGFMMKESKPPSEKKSDESLIKTPEAEEAKKKREEEIAKQQTILLMISALRDETKNPPSFELVEAIKLKDGTLCVTYRGTNSFGGVVTENKAISNGFKIVSYAANCNGKVGDDFTHLKKYLKKL